MAGGVQCVSGKTGARPSLGSLWDTIGPPPAMCMFTALVLTCCPLHYFPSSPISKPTTPTHSYLPACCRVLLAFTAACHHLPACHGRSFSCTHPTIYKLSSDISLLMMMLFIVRQAHLLVLLFVCCLVVSVMGQEPARNLQCLQLEGTVPACDCLCSEL